MGSVRGLETYLSISQYAISACGHRAYLRLTDATACTPQHPIFLANYDHCLRGLRLVHTLGT